MTHRRPVDELLRRAEASRLALEFSEVAEAVEA